MYLPVSMSSAFSRLRLEDNLLRHALSRLFDNDISSAEKCSHNRSIGVAAANSLRINLRCVLSSQVWQGWDLVKRRMDENEYLKSGVDSR